MKWYVSNWLKHQYLTVLKKVTKFTGKHLWQSLFFNKVACLRPATLVKKRLWHRCFSVNFVKFLRTAFLMEQLRWRLLHWVKMWNVTMNSRKEITTVYVLESICIFLLREKLWEMGFKTCKHFLSWCFLGYKTTLRGVLLFLVY